MTPCQQGLQNYRHRFCLFVGQCEMQVRLEVPQRLPHDSPVPCCLVPALSPGSASLGLSQGLVVGARGLDAARRLIRSGVA